MTKGKKEESRRKGVIRGSKPGKIQKADRKGRGVRKAGRGSCFSGLCATRVRGS